MPVFWRSCDSNDITTTEKKNGSSAERIPTFAPSSFTWRLIRQLVSRAALNYYRIFRGPREFKTRARNKRLAALARIANATAQTIRNGSPMSTLRPKLSDIRPGGKLFSWKLLGFQNCIHGCWVFINCIIYTRMWIWIYFYSFSLEFCVYDCMSGGMGWRNV